MEGTPFINQEDNSEDTDEEFGADGRFKKKLKKKIGPEWFQKFTAGAENQPEEESKTSRFLDAVRSPFSRLFGIEKDEVEEDSEKVPKEPQEETEYQVPFIPGPDSSLESVEPVRPESAQDSADTEPELPHGLIIDQETVEEFAGWSEPINSEATTEGATPDDAMAIEDSESSELSVDRLRAEVEAHAMPSHEVPTERHPDITSFDNPTRGEFVPSTKERELVVEKRGGAGAAAVGFVAADLLSRSRDKKIRKEAKQLKKKVTNLEKKQETDYLRTQRLQAQNKEQLRDLAAKREYDLKAQAQKIELIREPEPRSVVDTGVERTHTTADQTIRYDKDIGEIPKSESMSLERGALNDQSTHEDLVRQKQELLASIEQAKEVSYAGETYYDRQHEVMDVPTKYDMVSGMSVANRPKKQAAVSKASSTVTQQAKKLSVPFDPLPQKAGLSDEYKKAMVQGATTGIILLVGLLIGFIIWSLL